VPVRTTITKYALDEAEQALADLRGGRFEGTAVIVP
jgi:propanol-preferring alcohol dehydrogenase